YQAEEGIRYRNVTGVQTCALPISRVKEHLDYVPQSLENVVMRSTAKSLEHRYSSVQEMLNDLSTSLSVNRMNEKRFDPETDIEDTLIIIPIKPISTGSQTL